MLFHGEAFDQRIGPGGRNYFLNRKRRFLVNRFRNKRRRTDRFWKHTEFVRYLRERLLFVGPMQGGVVEAPDDGGLDDFEIGRDVEVARHVEGGVADMQDLATRLLASSARDLRQNGIADGIERLCDQCRADHLGRIARAERDQPPPPTLWDRQR